MSYCISKTTGNGYRCACCRRTYDHTEWVDDRAEAIAMVPTAHQGNSDWELVHVEVRDGATGAVIAEGKLRYASSRAEAYRIQCWSGHVEGVRFEEIRGGQPGESWVDIVARMVCEAAEKKLAAAKATANAAAAEVERLKGGA